MAARDRALDRARLVPRGRASPKARGACRGERETKRPPSELELLEGQIAGVEATIAQLERTLADDWTDMDVLGAHRAARDELVRLLERWEVLFAQAPAT